MSEPMDALPDIEQIRAAAARIAPHARVTPVMRSAVLDALIGAELHFKCEHLQRGGAFKFRGACNAVWSLSDAQAAHGVVTHSSGNHGNALALAAATRGIAAHVVVPEGAVRAKVEAIERAGAILHRCAPTQAAREAKARRSAARDRRGAGASVCRHAGDGRAGHGGAGTAAAGAGLDALITPVGGGGLASGVAIAAHALDPELPLFGAEPLGADDAARSLASGERVTSVVPDTVCDGLRALIGERNLEALRTHRVELITVSDAETIAAMQLIWTELKQVVEVSSATVLAAMLKQPQRFAGRRVGVVITGGNVDLEALPW